MKVIPRWRWRAKKPTASKTAMIRPARGTIVHHTVTAGGKRTPKQERAHMRELQQIAFSRFFADISYSFIIFESGNVYEGRGWGVVGAHTEGSNSTTHGIAFVGNYETAKPSKASLDSARALIRKGVRNGHIKKGGSVIGHRDDPGAATACPGKHLFEKIGSIRPASL